MGHASGERDEPTRRRSAVGGVVVRDAVSLNPVNHGGAQLCWKSFELNAAYRFLIHDVGADLNPLENLTAELRALHEQLSVEPSHVIVTAHEHFTGSVLDHGVRRIALEETVQVTSVVGMHLRSDNIDGDELHRRTPRANGTFSSRQSARTAARISWYSLERELSNARNSPARAPNNMRRRSRRFHSALASCNARWAAGAP